MGWWLGGNQKEKVLGGVSGIITQLPESPRGPVTWMWLTLPLLQVCLLLPISRNSTLFFKNNTIIY